ncbi:MAG: type II toxin-antitoxin system VapB family antitoxin, partial [Terriglobales bacterium]
MPTNLALDDRLIEAARRCGGHRTKKAAVTAALEEYIQRRGRLRLLDLFGQVEFDPAYEYKSARRRSQPGAAPRRLARSGAPAGAEEGDEGDSDQRAGRNPGPAADKRGQLGAGLGEVGVAHELPAPT